MKRKDLLQKLALGPPAHVAFTDLKNLAVGFGFQILHVSGDHHIFLHPQVNPLLNLQDVGGEALPCQVRQFLRVVERYGLRLEDEP